MSTARVTLRVRGAAGALLALALMAGRSGGEKIVAGVTGRWDFDTWNIILRCSGAGGRLEDAAIPHYNRSALLPPKDSDDPTDREKRLYLYSCPLPRGSLAHALAARRYPAATLLRLSLYDQPPHPPPRAAHFASLHLRELTIYFAPTASPPHVDAGIFEQLAELYYLDMSGAVLSPMPAASRLEVVSLSDGQSTGVWGGCAALQDLTLDNWVVPEAAAQAAGAGWLAHCSQLTDLGMWRVPPHMQWWALRDTRALTWLEICECERMLPAAELNAAIKGLQLVWLDLSDNDITSSYLKELTFPSSLETLDLTGSVFDDALLNDTLSVWQKLARLPALRELSLRKCIFVDFCATLQAGGFLSTLSLFSLNDTHIGQLCFGSWDTLEELHLKGSGITELQLLQLPRPRAESLLVNLRGNDIRSVFLDEAIYYQLRARFNETGNVTIITDNMTLDCDCAHAWFARALRALPQLVLKGAVLCSGDATPLLSAPAERLECERFECGGCTCRRTWRDNATVATCEHGAARAVPRVPGLRALHAAGNRIDTLHAHDLQDTLLELDLSDNKISWLDAAAVGALFATRARQVWLAGNPFVCTCKSQVLVAALQQHHEQVPDFLNITCGDGRELHTLAVPELCAAQGQTALVASLAAGGMLVSLGALAGALYHRYGRELRIFLYARGICLCCMQEDELDAERPYDAFVSFAHADERLVTEQLLPELEREPHALKLCVHYRDWEPGEMIPTQIRLSVERSRRTVIILSRNFLRSVWGLLEFRLAHVSALQEGRVRVVVIVLDDVLDDPRMDAELRGYLRTHTYVVWGSRWFWDQLRYALPHRPARASHPSRARPVTPLAPNSNITISMVAQPGTSSISSSSRVCPVTMGACDADVPMSLAAPRFHTSSNPSAGCAGPVSPHAPDADVTVSMAVPSAHTSSPALHAGAGIELIAFDSCARQRPPSPGTGADVTLATADTAL